MSLSIGEKLPKLIFLVYLILAILGSFTLSDKTFHFVDFGRDILGSSGFFSSTTLTADWLIEDAPTISKAYRFSNPSLRNGLPRVFNLAGITGITKFHVKSNVKIDKSDYFPIAKNLVPLKLRI